MPKRILITGATGQLGPYLVRHLLKSNAHLSLWARQTHEPLLGVAVKSVDLLDADSVTHHFEAVAPDIVIHCAALSNIAGCYDNHQLAQSLNGEATARLAELAHDYSARIVYTSTDLVFDGKRENQDALQDELADRYTESDTPNPLSIYGKTKRAGETPVLESENGVVIRLPILFGPTLMGGPRFIDSMLAKFRTGQRVALFDDEWRTPLAVDTAAQGIALAADPPQAQSDSKPTPTGLFHFAGPDRLSRFEMGQILAAAADMPASLIDRTSRLSIDVPEARPADTSLCSDRWYQTFPHCPKPDFATSINRLFVHTDR